MRVRCVTIVNSILRAVFNLGGGLSVFFLSELMLLVPRVSSVYRVFPLTAERPLYSERTDTQHRTPRAYTGTLQEPFL